MRSRLLHRMACVSAVAAVALAAVSAPARAATGVILDHDSPLAIPGSYIVAVQPSAMTGGATLASVAHSLTATYGGTVGDLDNGFGMFTLSANDAVAEQIAGDSRVDNVDQDEVESALGVQQDAPWGLARINERQLSTGNSTYSYAPGQGTVYVVDSGMQVDNSDFGGRASYAYNALNDTTAAPDCVDGHGTHVASVVGGQQFGVAKNVTLKAVKVLACDTNSGRTVETDTSKVIRGLDWIFENGVAPSVVNMSVGGAENIDKARAIQELQSRDITVVIAAGNANGDACNEFPGTKIDGRRLDSIFVGATGGSTPSTAATDTRWISSSPALGSDFGDCVTLFAPGAWIPGASPVNPSGVLKSGTSAAAPHVAGAAALILAANPGDTPAQVKAALVANATSSATNGGNPVIANRGDKSPDLLLYVPPPAAHAGDGSVVTVSAPPPNQASAVTFTTTSPNQPLYATARFSQPSSCWFDSYTFKLYDHTGAPVASHSMTCMGASGNGLMFSPLLLATPDTYTIQITAPPNAEEGTLSVQIWAGAGGVNHLNNDGSVNAVTTTAPGQAALSAFTTTTPNQPLYTASAFTTIDSCAGTSVHYYLYDNQTADQVATGSIPCSDGSSGSNKPFDPMILADAGTYTVLFFADSSNYGTTNLQVWTGSSIAALTSNGSVNTLNTTVPGQARLATFTTTNPNQPVYATAALAMNSGCTGNRETFNLYDATTAQISTGFVVCSGTTGSGIALGPLVIARPGTYTLLSLGSSTMTGTTRLQVWAGGGGVGSVHTDGTITGFTASSPGQSSLMTFTTTSANQSVYATAAQSLMTGSQVSSVHYYLYDSGANQLATGFVMAAIGNSSGQPFNPVILAQPGTYTLLIVPDGDVQGPGNLQLWVGGSGVGDASPNGVTTVLTTSPGQGAALAFTTAASNTTVTATATIATAVCPTSVSFYLYGPDTTQIASGFVPVEPVEDKCVGAGPLFPQTALPNPGTYTILVVPGGTALGSMAISLTS